MKVRTEAKREAILEEAAKVFMELGYERTSMAEISARVGGSKATLYGYFPSKELLFVEAARAAVGEEYLQDSIKELKESAGQDLRDRLLRFAEKVLLSLSSAEGIAQMRMVIGEANRTDIGRIFYEMGPQRGHADVAEVLRRAMDHGQLKRGDPTVMAFQFTALVNAENFFRIFQRNPSALSPEQVKAMAERAVATFLHGHAA